MSTIADLTDIQQAFVRRYIDVEGVVGVRIGRDDGEFVLFVDADAAVDMPDCFKGVPVRVRQGRRAVLAYK